MKRKKILINGTTGFIGSRMLEFLLKNKFDVTEIIRKDNKSFKILKKKYKSNYQSIKIKNDFKKILNKKKFDYFINLATFYKKKYSLNDVTNLIESNINFPMSILKIIYHQKIIFINFGSMMEYKNNIKSPLNIYATSKIFFEDISLLFNIKNQYNLKLYETFDYNDHRKKIIKTIIDCFQKKKKFILEDKNLKLNFISIENINKTILDIIYKKIKPGTYVLKNIKFVNIEKILKKINSLYPNSFKYYNIKKSVVKKEKNLSVISFKFNLYKNLIKILNANQT